MLYICPVIMFQLNYSIPQSVNCEMKVKAKNGNEYYLVEVIAHILLYLKEELITKFRRIDYHLNATDFDWVITVPAIWGARGKQIIREAGYKVSVSWLVWLFRVCTVLN